MTLKRLLNPPKLDFRPDPDTMLILLRPLLVGTALLGCTSLIVWLTGFVDNFFAPWDGLYLIAISAATEFALSRDFNVQTVASIFLAAAIQPVFYYALMYGPTSPTLALFLPALVFMALLGGHGYIQYAVGLVLFFVVVSAVYNQQGWGLIEPIERQVVIQMTVFWSVLCTATAALGWLFARTMYRVIQVANGQRTALTYTTSVLANESDPEQVQLAVLQSIAEQLSAQWGTVYLLRGEQLTVAGGIADGKAVTHIERDIAPKLAETVPVWEELAARREPLIIDDIANDPRLLNRALMLSQNLKAVLYLPLAAGDELLGMLSINRTSRRRFLPDEVDLGAALAVQLALAIQLTRIASHMREGAILKERNRMAREIHDTLAQGFTGIVVQLEAAEDVLEDGEQATAYTHLERARQLARGSLAEARRSVWALRSQALEARSLPQAVQQVVATLLDGTAVSGSVEVSGEHVTLSQETDHAVLRIMQEAVTNALRHAQPQHIRVELQYTAEALTVRIIDDGRGFDPDAVRAGFGLRGMQERIEGVGGTLSIDSTRGTGTCVQVEVNHEQ